MSQAEDQFAEQICGLVPEPIREYRFHPVRRWRFDFAWPDHRMAVEVEGLCRGRGRHQTIKGYTADCEKYNEAALLGWTVLRFPQSMVKSGVALDAVQRLFNNLS